VQGGEITQYKLEVRTLPATSYTSFIPPNFQQEDIVPQFGGFVNTPEVKQADFRLLFCIDTKF